MAIRPLEDHLGYFSTRYLVVGDGIEGTGSYIDMDTPMLTRGSVPSKLLEVGLVPPILYSFCGFYSYQLSIGYVM